ncbi:glycoside hydrolase family 16 protein [Methylovirgula sp. 4M-Z18]|nr:glycoside hydrolase family 16 protein [Methylovirgula sp. 4M-Z18]
MTLNATFSAPVRWRRGAIDTNARPKPLTDPSFSWKAGYIWDHPMRGETGGDRDAFPAWTSNVTAEASPNGDLIARLGPQRSPISFAGGLRLTARPMPPDLAATVSDSDPRDYISGTITSFPYAQTYGVFAMSAKVPRGAGLWPAFWLIPADNSWPPEIDVMEVVGREPSTVYTTVHTNVPNRETSIGHGTVTHLDLSAAYHEYAVDWGPERIDWYFDGKLIFSRPTPPDLHKPCYIIANLSVGKPDSWDGAPDAATEFPATMQIAYIRAWQRPEYAGAALK